MHAEERQQSVPRDVQKCDWAAVSGRAYRTVQTRPVSSRSVHNGIFPDFYFYTHSLQRPHERRPTASRREQVSALFFVASTQRRLTECFPWATEGPNPPKEPLTFKKEFFWQTTSGSLPAGLKGVLVGVADSSTCRCAWPEKVPSSLLKTSSYILSTCALSTSLGEVTCVVMAAMSWYWMRTRSSVWLVSAPKIGVAFDDSITTNSASQLIPVTLFLIRVWQTPNGRTFDWSYSDKTLFVGSSVILGDKLARFITLHEAPVSIWNFTLRSSISSSAITLFGNLLPIVGFIEWMDSALSSSSVMVIIQYPSSSVDAVFCASSWCTAPVPRISALWRVLVRQTDAKWFLPWQMSQVLP